MDADRLERLEVNCDLKVELRTLMQELDPTASTSLATLAQRLLGMNLDKELQDDDYSQDPLPLENRRYAALDALVSRKCAEKIMSELHKKRHTRTTCNIIMPLHELDEGDNVFNMLSRKIVAEGVVTFLGRDGLMKK